MKAGFVLAASRLATTLAAAQRLVEPYEVVTVTLPVDTSSH